MRPSSARWHHSTSRDLSFKPPETAGGVASESSAALAAAQNRACRKIYVQTEFYPEKSQRIDALVILRLSPDNPRSAEEVGPIPFFDGSERNDEHVTPRERYISRPRSDFGATGRPF